jgi:prevent-host-death family protein
MTRLYPVGTAEMKIWPVQDAKARFSELLDTCLREGPQIVTKRGAETAVLMPMDDWRRLQRSARPTLKELLLADEPRLVFPLPVRGRRRRRPPNVVA